MGYYTNYKLEMDSKEKVPSCKHTNKGVKFCPECGVKVGVIDIYDVVVQHLKDNYSDSYDIFSIVDEVSDGWKWYEHEKTMREISTKFPSVLFTLIGKGEEAGDMWRKYFKGGKMQTANAVISFDAFDEKKLS